MRTLMLPLLAGALLTATAAESAQMVCGERESLVQALANKYQERRDSVGLTSGGNLLELFVSGKNGTWTLILSTTDGAACVLTAGEAWEKMPEGPEA